MSASTVSITANTVAIRRRPVEKKPGLDLVGGDEMVAASPTSNGRGKIAGGDIIKDPSHSIRGEAVTERSRDVTGQVKKPLSPNSYGLPRRTTRKSVPKPDKPWWLTVIIKLTMLFVGFIVFVGLAELIRKLHYSKGNVVSVVSNIERRIAEMEAFVTTTTQMMQDQVDFVDGKIESEISGLRKEFDKKIEDKGLEFVAEFKNLDGRTESLEKFLGELSATEWLKKDDFDRFLEEFKKAKGIDSASDIDDVKLDEVRAFAREIVEREIEKHAADGLGRVDYALAPGGAIVVKHSEPYVVVKKGGRLFYETNWKGVHVDAEKMLRPSFGEPGHCFPLKESSGFVEIKLRTAIVPEAITLEHVAKSVAYDGRMSAPKHCRVYGWLQRQQETTTDSAVDIKKKMFLLMEFTYDLEKSNAQTFEVLDSAGSGMVVDLIRLEFSSNHGSLNYTCIYRFRVHGHEPNMLSMQS